MSLTNHKDSFMKEWMGECKSEMVAVTLIRLQLDACLSLREGKQNKNKNKRFCPSLKSSVRHLGGSVG